MERIENDCVGCDYCINCGRKSVRYLYCDQCGCNEQNLYRFGDKDYCYDCLIKELMEDCAYEIITDFFDEIKEYYDIGVVE